MKKKIIIISLIVLGVIGLGIGGFFLVKNFNNKPEEVKEEKKEEEKKVVSSLYIDINPSIRIDLDKDMKVINIVAINDDAKDIIYKDYKDKDLDFVLRKVTDNVINSSLVVEKQIVLLIGSKDDIDINNISKMITDDFSKQDIHSTILVQEINDAATEIASKYNISITKASFIEQKLQGKGELEELADSSINTLYEKFLLQDEEPKQEEKKEEPKQEETKKNTGGNSGNSGNSGTVAYSCTPPSDLKSTEWCNWNIKRPQSCEYSYPLKKSYTELEKIAHSALGFSENDIVTGGAHPKVHSGASYCESYYAEMKYQDTMYYIELDSVTGEVLSKSQKTITYAITEEQAKQMAIAYWKINAEDIDTIWVSNGTDGKPNGPGTYIRFQVNMQMKDGKKYSVDYDATTGQYVSSRSW